VSRAAVFSLLSTDTTLHTIGFPAAAVFASNAADDPPEQFVVIRWEDMPSASLGGHDRSFGPQIITVWFHDHDRTYEKVSAGIDRVKAILDAAIHVPGVDGWTITQCDWQGDSGDLWDDGYRTVTRNTSYRIVARPS
jgi:hypothetical protein